MSAAANISNKNAHTDTDTESHAHTHINFFSIKTANKRLLFEVRIMLKCSFLIQLQIFHERLFLVSNVSDTHDFMHRSMYGNSMRDFKQTREKKTANKSHALWLQKTNHLVHSNCQCKP